MQSDSMASTEAEVWVPVRDFPKYEVSNWGNVRNVKTGTVLQPGVKKHGYKVVSLSKPGVIASATVHRLVATHFIPNPESKPKLDHIDNDRTNNHVSNLRWATNTENCRNKTASRTGSSKYLGVSWSENSQKWAADIRVNKKHVFLGYYWDEEDAAHAYDIAARQYFGEFANVNFEHAPETAPARVVKTCEGQFSKYIGVSWHKQLQKYYAYIYRDRKKVHLGVFGDEEEAARAFDQAAKELRGDKAVLNFPDAA